jgi:hypothetical protein
MYKHSESTRHTEVDMVSILTLLLVNSHSYHFLVIINLTLDLLLKVPVQSIEICFKRMVLFRVGCGSMIGNFFAHYNRLVKKIDLRMPLTNDI